MVKWLSIRTVGISLIALALISCSNMGEDEASLFIPGNAIHREHTIGKLTTATLLNLQSCPGSELAARYFIQAVLPEEVNQPLYDANSVGTCEIALAASPCSLYGISSTLTLQNLYLGVLRTCNLRPVGLH